MRPIRTMRLCSEQAPLGLYACGVTLAWKSASTYERHATSLTASIKNLNLGCRLFLDIAIGVELLEVGPQIVVLLLVFDPRKGHLGAWDFGAGILNVFLEVCLIPP